MYNTSKVNIVLFFVLILNCQNLFAQPKKIAIKGMYFQWGYNIETYTKSNIHFNMSNGNEFTLHNVKAKDKPDFDAIYKHPFDITIPQYNYRIGFYLNNKKTKAIEINFDHTKYVVTDWQTVKVTGFIDQKKVDEFRVLDPKKFLHFEHTDGANWFHFNYVYQIDVLSKYITKPKISTIFKVGTGFNIPRTDFTWKGNRYNNEFHISGYNIGFETGSRIYFSQKCFLEITGKTGFVNYVNALANTEFEKGNRATHNFGYVEGIATFGYDISFLKRKKK